MTVSRNPSRRIRRVLNAVGVSLVIGVIVAIATFNASTQQRELPDFSMPEAMLFQLRDDNRHAVMSAVVTKQGSTWLVIPRDTVMDITDRTSTISNTAQAVTLNGAVDALASSTEFNIDAVWQIDRLGIAAFVESIGGVDVTPNRDMILGDEKSVDRMVLYKGQRVHLDGIFAAWYALGNGSASRQNQLIQFREVWSALLRDIDAASLNTILESVGSVSRASLPTPELVAVFEKWQQVAAVSGNEWIGVKTRYIRTVQGQIRVISPEGYRQFLDAGVRERITP